MSLFRPTATQSLGDLVKRQREELQKKDAEIQALEREILGLKKDAASAEFRETNLRSQIDDLRVLRETRENEWRRLESTTDRERQNAEARATMLADALIGTANAPASADPCWCHGREPHMDHSPRCESRRSILRLAGRL